MSSFVVPQQQQSPSLRFASDDTVIFEQESTTMSPSQSCEMPAGRSKRLEFCVSFEENDKLNYNRKTGGDCGESNNKQKKIRHNQESIARFNQSSFDPRTVLPTRRNLDMVSNLVQHVYSQLQDDDERVSRHPESRSAREALRESIEYVKLLQQWVSQETISTEPACKQELPVVSSADELPRVADCLLTASPECYVRIKSIRESIYGCVEMYQVASRLSNGSVVLSFPAQFVAIKCFDKERVLQRRSRTGFSVQEDPIRELAIQQRLSSPGHPNVIPVLAIMETDRCLYAVYPFIGQDMFDYISDCKRVSEREAKRLFACMVDAIAYCERMGVCHRDISLENFLMKEVQVNGKLVLEPVLIDFGLSVVMAVKTGGEEFAPIPHTGAVGKEFYMAPEVFHNSGIAYDGCKTDTWSMGICLGIMLTGFPLWTCPSEMDERFRVLVLQKRIPDVLKEWKFNFSPECVCLLKQMLDIAPQARPSMEQIMSSKWMM